MTDLDQLIAKYDKRPLGLGEKEDMIIKLIAEREAMKFIIDQFVRQREEILENR